MHCRYCSLAHNYQYFSSERFVISSFFSRDALCLAQLRLHPEDTQTAEVALQWAASLGREGNHEQAAKWYETSYTKGLFRY